MIDEHNNTRTEKNLSNSVYEAERNLGIEEAITRFDNYLKTNEKSVSTRDIYTRSVRAFYKSFDKLTKENMIQFKALEIERHSPNTARLRVTAMNQFCDYMFKDECKVSRVKIYAGTTSLENVPTLSEYYYFLECLKNSGYIKMYWMVKFIASTGVRASELVSLEKSCLETGTFTMFSKGKIRKILIPGKLINESREYFNSVEGKYLFPNYRGEKMQAVSVSKMMKSLGRRFYIRDEILHAHAYRHLFAILFLENNKDLTLLSNLLGHESVRTTAIYTKLSLNKQKEALDKAMNW